MLKVAVRAPVMDGRKVTLIVQLPLAATEPWQLFFAQNLRHWFRKS